jgi:hypothetical protein
MSFKASTVTTQLLPRDDRPQSSQAEQNFSCSMLDCLRSEMAQQCFVTGNDFGTHAAYPPYWHPLCRTLICRLRYQISEQSTRPAFVLSPQCGAAATKRAARALIQPEEAVRNRLVGWLVASNTAQIFTHVPQFTAHDAHTTTFNPLISLACLPHPSSAQRQTLFRAPPAVACCCSWHGFSAGALAAQLGKAGICVKPVDPKNSARTKSAAEGANCTRSDFVLEQVE